MSGREGETPQRVLHVFASFGRGGSQVRAAALIERWRRPAVHAVLAAKGSVDPALLPPSCEVLPAARRGSLPAPFGTFAAIRAQRRFLRERRPDLVLTYNWGAIETAAAARGLGLRLVHHEDGFGPDEAERRLLRRNWARRAWLAGVPVIVPSAVLAGIALREWGLDRRNVHHLPNGADCARFRPRAGRPEGPLVVGTVGGLRAEKDHAALVRAFAAVPGDAQLLLAGDGPLRADLEALAASLGVAARVRFAGAVADPAAAYASMDVFALSSRTEQMPLSLLEAMASGLPVAATDVGDVRAVLPEGSRGGVVPRGDEQALAGAIAALLADAGRRAREGAANRRRCEERYEIGACLAKYLDVYG